MDSAFDFDGLDGFIRQSPFHQWLGVRLHRLDADGIALLLPWRPEFVSVAEIGYTHGGVLATLIDLAADYAIAARIGRGAPTIDLRVDYHKAAMPGTLLAVARVVKLGRTVSTAEAQIFNESGTALYASGRGAYLTMTRET